MSTSNISDSESVGLLPPVSINSMELAECALDGCKNKLAHLPAQVVGINHHIFCREHYGEKHYGGPDRGYPRPSAPTPDGPV